MDEFYESPEKKQRKELTKMFNELGVKGIKGGDMQHETHHKLLGLFVTFDNQKKTLENFCNDEDFGIKVNVDPLYLNLRPCGEVILYVKDKKYTLSDDIAKKRHDNIAKIMAKYKFSEL